MTRWARLKKSVREQWWAHLFIAMLLSVVFNDIGRPWLHLLAGFASSLVISVCIGTATTAAYVMVWDLLSRTKGWFPRALIHGGIVVVGVLVGTEVAIQLLRLTLYAGVEISMVRQGIWRVGLAITVVAMVVSVAYDRLRDRARTHELREQQAQHALLRAQIDNLQAKVNPHFLFNALNTVASLVEEDPERAIEGIERLSALLRYSLEGARKGRVPLHLEVDAVRSYLALEQLRFGERLRSTVELDPSVGMVQVPPFVLQPLVENAVKHGIGRSREGGTVRVQARESGTTLALIVDDDGPPGDSDAPGTQTGHDNLRQRLALIYGADATFDAGPADDGGYRVRMVLPRTAADDDAQPSPHQPAAPHQPEAIAP